MAKDMNDVVVLAPTRELMTDPVSLSVGTHDGKFHADEVMACALLCKYHHLPVYVFRTRDPKLLTWCDALVDVGGAWDPVAMRFDHHQGTYTGDKSSAGMVLDWLVTKCYIDMEVADQLRHEYMDEIDAIDNGRTSKVGTSFSGVISALNHHNNDMIYEEPQTQRFEYAVKFVITLLDSLEPTYEQKVADWKIIRPMLDELPHTAEILELPEYMHWHAPVGLHENITRVIWPDHAKDEWCVQVPNRPGSIPGKPPSSFDLKPGTELYTEAMDYVKGCIFVHQGRWFGKTKTREQAYELAKYVHVIEYETRIDMFKDNPIKKEKVNGNSK